jgi:putative DNA primase/helicase
MPKKISKPYGIGTSMNRPDLSGLVPTARTDPRTERWAADVLADHLITQARYVPKEKSWYVWQDYRWMPDSLNEVPQLVERYMDALSVKVGAEANPPGAEPAPRAERKETAAFRRALATLPFRTRMMTLLESRLPLDVASFDQDDYVLNTPAGLYDLRTGRLLGKDPAALCRSATKVAPEAGRPSRWIEVLEHATGGDQEFIDWLQRQYGYALTGLNVEKQILVVWGPPHTSKSVVDRVTHTLMGDYHAVIPHGELFEAKRDRHTTGLAQFLGARLASSSEVNEKARWRADIVKAITGGDPVPARFMRQDNETYQPKCKLFLFGNNLPGTNGADSAIVARVFPVPFGVPVQDPNKHLGDQLIAEEGPRILHWMMEGAAAYLREGLGALPTVVREAAAEYRDLEDDVAAFIADRLEIQPGAETTTDDLYREWLHWCHSQGERDGAGLSKKQFGRRFKPGAESAGAQHKEKTRAARVSGYEGLRIRSPFEEQAFVIPINGAKPNPTKQPDKTTKAGAVGTAGAD